MWSAAENAQFFIWLAFQAEAKVDDLDVLRCDVHQYIVELEVTVRVVLRVHIGDAADQLFENMFTGVLR